MSRYVDIECDSVTEILNRRAFKSREDIQDFLDNIPTVDVEPIKYRYWICENLGFGAYRYRCSECGNIYGQDQIEEFKHNKFCGDCGARMNTE